MILINSTPYHDHDMPDKICICQVGRMTQVLSAGCDRQLEDSQKDHGNLSSAVMAESINNLELELVNQNCFSTNSVMILGNIYLNYSS